ncbi:hypothetical protein PV05_03809 [Exophiala xenobiotica]|uniref:Aspartate racemase n=1 Tax=Exophiala xenobiotica TaxID=348802 RepID=A0A0D2EX67_9EURO|nr:uncharacterized protein PV05_03809 [Exophiala xenobiotica]KIW59355.1 hypothetical protein PV05_03809 [Exophiala xenobiotica]
MTKTVGLIGGFSWQTMAIYYQEINEYVNSKLGGIHSANLLIRSIDYSDLASMVSAKDLGGMTAMLCACGQQLKAANAQALSTGLPVLHICDFTARQIVDKGHRRVGLLATRAVMEEDFYKDRLRGFGLEVYVPDEDFRSDADRMIFCEMSKEQISQGVKTTWHTAYQDLVQDHNVDCIILGCTELRLVFGQEDLTAPTFETTTIHARGIADWALAESTVFT